MRAASADLGANFDELREEDRVERTLQELDPRRATRAGLTADDALDRLHVMEAPRLEVDLDVDEPFRDFVRGPVLIGMQVDRLQHLDDAGVMLVRLRPVSFDARLGHAMPDAV